MCKLAFNNTHYLINFGPILRTEKTLQRNHNNSDFLFLKHCLEAYLGFPSTTQLAKPTSWCSSLSIYTMKTAVSRLFLTLIITIFSQAKQTVHSKHLLGASITNHLITR